MAYGDPFDPLAAGSPLGGPPPAIPGWPPAHWPDYGAMPIAAPPLDPGSTPLEGGVAASTPPPPPIMGPPIGPPIEGAPVPDAPVPAAAPPAPPAIPFAAAPAAAPGAPPFGPVNVGEPSPWPAPIDPEKLDLGPPTITDQWYADPLHAPADVAQSWAENATPQDILNRQGMQEEARRTKALLDQTRADEENLRTLRTDIEARKVADAATQAKSDAIVADAVRLAQTKTDPDRWMSTRTGGQRVAAFLSAIVGGLVQGRTGAAHNQGMDAIQHMIDRDIDAQKADIENGKYALGVRQNAVSQEFARNGNLFQAAETVRLATYQAAINKLQTEQQNFDPHGTRWLNYAGAIQDMKSRAAAAAEATRKTIFEENYKKATIDIQRQNAERELWKAKQDAALGWAKEGRERAAAAAKDGQVFTPAELQALHPGAPVPPIGMTAKDYKGWIESAKTGQEIVNQSRSHTNVVPMVTVRDPKTGAETPFIAEGRPEEVDKLKVKVGAVTKIVGLVDEAMRLRTGWSTEIGNSEERQKLDAIWGNAMIEAKNAAELGQITPNDMTLIKGMLGTDSPSKLRDPIPGMKEARSLLLQNVNVDLHGHGLPKDQSYDIPAPPAAPSAADQLTGRTALEQGQDAKLTGIGKAVQPQTSLPRVLLGDKLIANPEVDAENAAKVGPTGLALEDNAKVLDAISKASAAPPTERAAVVDKLTAWASSDRPSISSGVLGLLRGQAPTLYEQVLARLPEARRAEAQRFDAGLQSIHQQQGPLPAAPPQNKPLPPEGL